MEVCQRALEKSSTETTEYEAVGINVGKKFGKDEQFTSYLCGIVD
jgi:hypothetical protein